MRKAALLLSVIMFLSCLAGCGEETKTKGESVSSVVFETASSHYSYPQQGLNSFDVAGDGRVFCSLESENNTVKLLELSLDGQTAAEHEFSLEITDMSANNLTLSDSGDCLYFTSTRRSMDNPSVAYPVIYKYNLSDKSGEEVCEFPDYKSVSNLKIVGDTLYFIAVDRKKAEEGAYVNTVEWYYSYGGEVMNSYNLKTGELSQIAVDFPVSFYADGDTLRIFVYNNSQAKYGFVTLNTKNGSVGDFTEKNMNGFTSCGGFDKNLFMYTVSDGFVYASGFDKSDGISEIIRENGIASELKIKGGHAFYLVDELIQKKLVRIKISEYYKPLETLTVISGGYGENDLPDVNDISLSIRSLSDEEFALTLLSQSDDYDLCVLSASSRAAENLKNKGVYYPLNDISGVLEYLDKCFSYIKDTAIAENEKVWMIPVSLDASVILYNKELCEAAGIDFSKPLSNDELADMLINYCNESGRDNFNITGFTILQNALYEYNSNNDSYDTEQFRSLAVTLKDKVWANIDSVFAPHQFSTGMLGTTDYSEVLFTVSRNGQSQIKPNSHFDSVCAFPKIDAENKNPITATYICVNPNSKKLELAKKYVESVVKTLLSENNSVQLKDSLAYPDTEYGSQLNEVYENGELVFGLPNEIVYDDFEKYALGEIDLESYITNADRKLSAYLNE